MKGHIVEILNTDLYLIRFSA